LPYEAPDDLCTIAKYQQDVNMPYLLVTSALPMPLPINL